MPCHICIQYEYLYTRFQVPPESVWVRWGSWVGGAFRLYQLRFVQVRFRVWFVYKNHSYSFLFLSRTRSLPLAAPVSDNFILLPHCVCCQNCLAFICSVCRRQFVWPGNCEWGHGAVADREPRTSQRLLIFYDFQTKGAAHCCLYNLALLLLYFIFKEPIYLSANDSIVLSYMHFRH